MKGNIEYIEKLLKLKKDVYNFMKNNNALLKGNNFEMYFTFNYIPIKLAFNKLNVIDDSIYNFIVCLVYNLIFYNNNIKPQYRKLLLPIVEEYYL